MSPKALEMGQLTGLRTGWGTQIGQLTRILDQLTSKSSENDQVREKATNEIGPPHAAGPPSDLFVRGPILKFPLFDEFWTIGIF